MLVRGAADPSQWIMSPASMKRPSRSSVPRTLSNRLGSLATRIAYLDTNGGYRVNRTLIGGIASLTALCIARGRRGRSFALEDHNPVPRRLPGSDSEVRRDPLGNLDGQGVVQSFGHEGDFIE